MLKVLYRLGFEQVGEGFYEIEGGKIYLSNKQGLSSVYRKYDIFEPETLDFIKKYVTKDMKVLELGSCLGYFTLYLAKYGKEVLGIEGNEDYLRLLRQTVRNISNIKLVGKYLGNKVSDKEMVLKEIKMKGVDLVFMDIEGAEVIFFEQLLKMKSRPKIFVEWHIGVIGIEKSRELLKRLSKDYHINKIWQNHFYMIPKQKVKLNSKHFGVL